MLLVGLVGAHSRRASLPGTESALTNQSVKNCTHSASRIDSRGGEQVHGDVVIKHLNTYHSWEHKVLTYTEYRAVSGVFRTIDPPPPLHPASESCPRTKGGGVHTRRAVRGWGVNISPDIGLASYSIIHLWLGVMALSCGWEDILLVCKYLMTTSRFILLLGYLFMSNS